VVSTTSLTSEEEIMSATAMVLEPLLPESFVPELPAASRARGALHSLMRMWEQPDSADDGESEVELMVMLSGMVGSHATHLDEQ
jgi:hypothetical protein